MLVPVRGVGCVRAACPVPKGGPIAVATVVVRVVEVVPAGAPVERAAVARVERQVVSRVALHRLPAADGAAFDRDTRRGRGRSHRIGETVHDSVVQEKHHKRQRRGAAGTSYDRDGRAGVRSGRVRSGDRVA